MTTPMNVGRISRLSVPMRDVQRAERRPGELPRNGGSPFILRSNGTCYSQLEKLNKTSAALDAPDPNSNEECRYPRKVAEVRKRGAQSIARVLDPLPRTRADVGDNAAHPFMAPS